MKKMKNLSLTFLLVFAFAISSHACLNRYYTLDKDGHIHENEHGALIKFNTNFDKSALVGELWLLADKLKKEHSYMALSDYAVLLLKLGKKHEALQLLITLYSHYPDEYKLASNLGTAYELNGNNDSALKYIRRGIELNPDDHEGSEWIHEKILLAKINLQKDPSWLASHTVLGLTESQENDSAVRVQLHIQLQERFPFTSPVADPIMASLMTDLGDLNYNTHSVAIAIVCYKTASNYFEGTDKSLHSKIYRAEKLNAEQAKKELAPQKDHSGRPRGARLLTYASYENAFVDNDWQHYKINWNEIETDPKKLLALVDLNMPSKEAKQQALKNQSGELKFVPDSSDKKIAEADLPPIEQGRGKTNSNSWMIILLSSVTVILVGGLIYRLSSKRGNK